ncbi:hypothetical protein EVA_17316, partial [gut metagenome]
VECMSSSMKKTEQVYRWVMAYIDKNKFSNNQKYLLKMPFAGG